MREQNQVQNISMNKDCRYAQGGWLLCPQNVWLANLVNMNLIKCVCGCSLTNKGTVVFLHRNRDNRWVLCICYSNYLREAIQVEAVSHRAVNNWWESQWGTYNWTAFQTEKSWYWATLWGIFTHCRLTTASPLGRQSKGTLSLTSDV